MGMFVKLFVYILLAVSVSCFEDNKDDLDSRFDERIEIDRRIEMREVIQRRGGRRIDHDLVSNTDLEFTEIPGNQNLNPFLVWLKKLTDSGKFENCGPKGTKMDITWTPKTVSKSGSVTVTIDAEACKYKKSNIIYQFKNKDTAEVLTLFKLTRRHRDLHLYIGYATELTEESTISGRLTWNGFPVSIHKKFPCSSLKQMFQTLKCPVEKGAKLQGSTVLDLSNYPQIRSGNIGLDVTINNEKGEQFACLKGHIEVK